MGSSYNALLGGLGQYAQQHSFNQQQTNYGYQMQLAQQLQCAQAQPYVAPEAPPATRPGDDAVRWLKTRVWEVCKAWQ